MMDNDEKNRLRHLETQVAVMERELENIRKQSDSFKQGVNRGLWLIGGGFISVAITWLVNGGLSR